MLQKELIARDANWVSIASLTSPMQVKAKIRSSHPHADALIQPYDAGMIRVTFSEPQKSLTPGQMVVKIVHDAAIGIFGKTAVHKSLKVSSAYLADRSFYTG